MAQTNVAWENPVNPKQYIGMSLKTPSGKIYTWKNGQYVMQGSNSGSGSNPPASGGSPPSPIKPLTAGGSGGGGGTYTVKPGDTLYGIYGANWRQLSGYAGDPTRLQVGTVLPAPPGADYSNVNDINGANTVINENQQNDADSVNENGEPETRQTLEDIMDTVREQITPDTNPPDAPEYSEALEEWRSEYGVTELETQLDELRNQEQELYAQREARTAAERGKSVAMNVIEGRIGEVERQENERLGVVQRSIANATNQLNTKYNIINTLMKTKEMDYNAAVTAYDKEMSTNISIFNAARSIDEANKTEIERAQDTARSNAQIVLNAYTESGLTYADLSAAEQANLTKMGVQSGLGADFFANVLKTSAGKPILTTITSQDDTKATIIYKDGTTKVISTGLPARVSTTKSDEDKDAEAREKDAEAYADKLTEQVWDGKLTREQARDRFKAKFPDFDENFIYDYVPDESLKDIIYVG